MRRLTSTQRIALGLVAAEAASLAVMSAVHLSGGKSGAGVPEAVICVVLTVGAAALTLRPEGGGRRAAQAAVVFAIAGFLVGLSFTIGGGSALDLAYHVVALPLLVVTLMLLRLSNRRAGQAS
jgi:hypothetical protein